MPSINVENSLEQVLITPNIVKVGILRISWYISVPHLNMKQFFIGRKKFSRYSTLYLH